MRSHLAMQMRLIIDERGTFWDVNSSALRRQYHLNDDNRTVERLLVRLVGCIALRTKGRALIAEFEPRIVSDSALAQLYYYLSDTRREPIFALSASENFTKMFPTFGDALKGISAMVASTRASNGGQCCITDLAVDLIERHSDLGELLHHRVETRATFDMERYRTLLDRRLSGRWLVLEASGTGGDFKILDCGSGYGVPTAEACRNMVGATLSDLPDQKFARWLSSSYEQSVSSSQPIYQSARTVAFWPDTGVVESEYVRLVLPLTASDGKSVLLTTSRRFSMRRLTRGAV